MDSSSASELLRIPRNAIPADDLFQEAADPIGESRKQDFSLFLSRHRWRSNMTGSCPVFGCPASIGLPEPIAIGN